VTLNTFYTISAGSDIKSFDLKSFWYGLATDTGTTEGIAQGGVISVVGFDVNGKQLPTIDFTYAPTGLINQPLTYGQFPSSYSNLKNVTIGVAVSEPITERTYIGLDDVIHVNHY
jgi:hypothetical protein